MSQTHWILAAFRIDSRLEKHADYPFPIFIVFILLKSLDSISNYVKLAEGKYGHER